MFARVIAGIWIAWAISWFAASRWSSPPAKRAGLGAEIPFRAFLAFGTVMLAVRAHGYDGALRFWHVGLVGVLTCILAMLVGIGFAWWGRIHLGPLWSGQITTKADHRVVNTGPYAIVRHPIYTGLLLAIFATAVAKGTLFGLVGAAFLTVGIWTKARLEEQWLSQELDPAAYASYRQAVPMLVPFGPK
jgi:protein-S-isoprenylcysteine O-methyltransferase Ste14